MHPISFHGQPARPAAPTVSGRSTRAKLRRARSGATPRIPSDRGTPYSGKRLGGVQQRRSTIVSFARHRSMHASAGKPEPLLNVPLPLNIRHAEGHGGPLAAYLVSDEHADDAAGLSLAVGVVSAGVQISSAPWLVHSTNFRPSPRVYR